MKALIRLQTLQAKRDHSRKELRDKLGRFFTKEEVEQALQIAEESRWLIDETELAKRFTEQLNRKKKSLRYIRDALRKRGLEAQFIDEETEQNKARALLESRFGKSSGFSYEERRKAYSYLSYRGYSPALIRKLVHVE